MFLKFIQISLIGLSFTAMVLLTNSCGLMGIAGSGVVKKEQRKIALSYDKVNLKGSGSVYITPSSSSSVTVEAEDNLLEYIITEVTNGELIIREEGILYTTAPIKIYVSADTFSKLRIEGSGNINCSNTITNKSLSLSISGSGSIFAKSETLTINNTISGSGDITSTGTTITNNSTISGSGSIAMQNLTGTIGKVNISGSGNCNINVKNSLSVIISGSGSVNVWGSPKITSTITGSGIVNNK